MQGQTASNSLRSDNLAVCPDVHVRNFKIHYYSMFSGMISMQRKEGVYMIPKTLPVLFTSGAEDPVGNFGKGVRKVYEKYRAAGIQDVSLHLYTGDGHEILNETDREQVYQDLLEWLEEHRKQK